MVRITTYFVRASRYFGYLLIISEAAIGGLILRDFSFENLLRTRVNRTIPGLFRIIYRGSHMTTVDATATAIAKKSLGSNRRSGLANTSKPNFTSSSANRARNEEMRFAAFRTIEIKSAQNKDRGPSTAWLAKQLFTLPTEMKEKLLATAGRIENRLKAGVDPLTSSVQYFRSFDNAEGIRYSANERFAVRLFAQLTEKGIQRLRVSTKGIALAVKANLCSPPSLRPLVEIGSPSMAQWLRRSMPPNK